MNGYVVDRSTPASSPSNYRFLPRLRGDAPLYRRGFQIGLAAVAMLVLLRVSIGWHFFYQGMWKVQNPDFSSEGFLRQAKGPLAEHFHDLIPDYHGRERLDLQNVLGDWHGYRVDFERFYGLSEDQQQAAESVFERRRELLEDYFADIDAERQQYFNELQRYEAARAEAPLFGMPYEQERLWQKQQELQATVRPWLAEIESQTEAFQRSLNEVLTEGQRARGRPPAEPTTLQRIDQLITLSNLLIGGCLMLGLLTRFSSLCGALFLASIVAAQPELPFVYPPAPASAGRSLLVNKEFIEMVALFVLATTRVGRWGGLDFFVHHLITRRLFGRKNTA